MSKENKHSKEKRKLDYLLRAIFLMFFVSGSYFIYSNNSGLGLLLWIVGFIIGIIGMIKFRSKESMKSIYNITYDCAPLLYIIGSILFILTLYIGFQQHRIDVPIVGFVFSAISIIVGVWNRKTMKKKLKK